MKAPTTAQTNNDSLFLNRNNNPGANAKDPTLKAIEEEIGKISLQSRQFKNETIEEIDNRIRKYESELKTNTMGLSNTVSKISSYVESLQSQIGELKSHVQESKPQSLDVELLKQEICSIVKESKPTEDTSTNNAIGKSLTSIRQDIAKMKENPPVYPNYDKELAELKNTVEGLRVSIVNTATKGDVNSLFGIVGSIKAPIDELRRTIANTDFGALSTNTFKSTVEKPSLTKADVSAVVKEHTDGILSSQLTTKQVGDMIAKIVEQINKLNKDSGDMFAKLTENFNKNNGTVVEHINKLNKENVDLSNKVIEHIAKGTNSVNETVKSISKGIADKVDSQIKTTKDILDGHQRSLKEMLDTNQRSLKEILDMQQRTILGKAGGDNNIDAKLNAFFDRIKTDIVIKMSERLDETIMQTKKLENYFVESRSQFSDSMRALSKKIDDSYLDKDTKEVIEKSIAEFMTKNKQEISDAVSNHITEDMITILKRLEDKFLTVKVENVAVPNVVAVQNEKVVHKPNPFSPFKKG